MEGGLPRGYKAKCCCCVGKQAILSSLGIAAVLFVLGIGNFFETETATYPLAFGVGDGPAYANNYCFGPVDPCFTARAAYTNADECASSNCSDVCHCDGSPCDFDAIASDISTHHFLAFVVHMIGMVAQFIGIFAVTQEVKVLVTCFQYINGTYIALQALVSYVLSRILGANGIKLLQGYLLGGGDDDAKCTDEYLDEFGVLETWGLVGAVLLLLWLFWMGSNMKMLKDYMGSLEPPASVPETQMVQTMPIPVAQASVMPMPVAQAVTMPMPVAQASYVSTKAQPEV